MFDWFFPSHCTVDPVTRAWIDRKLDWLDGHFETDGKPPTTILPAREFFPDPYDRSDKSVKTLVGRVCRYMDVDPEQIDVRLFDNPVRSLSIVDEKNRAVPTGAAGTYHRGDSRFVIRLERRQANDPMHLIGTVAHELAHVLLMGEGRVTGNEFDNEILTDLTVVHRGLGIFLANVPRHWESQTGTWPGTDVPMPMYMTTPMYGYALAACTVKAGPAKPPWRRHLRPGVRAEFDTAFRFLSRERTGV